ncbi:MAG: type II toxin-antitoxin system HicB family antitoxin [Paracoccaceae bacterium]|nr:type II toxin-antitoxin system HicB family antitoxin [Paracoccaceae bacterium]
MSDALDYAIVLVKLEEEDGGGYLGFVPDLPGCMSDGETQEEALANTKDALNEWISAQKEREAEIPYPGSAADEAIEHEHKLRDALRALAEYREEAEDEIAGLRRQLAELIALLKDEAGRLPAKFRTPSSPKTRHTKFTH